jgi:hypothetical protein
MLPSESTVPAEENDTASGAGPVFGVADATAVGGVLPPGAAVGVQAAASSAAAPITASTGSRKSPNRAFLVVCPVV